MSDDVKISKFNVLGADDRGVTANFGIPRKQSDFIFTTRKVGSLSGNTYHEGKLLATNPKTFLLLSGKILFSYRRIGTQNAKREEVRAPAVIEVSPYVTHNMKALEDIIVIECHSIKDIQNDRFKEDV